MAHRKSHDTLSIQDELGGAKAQRRKASMTIMMLGRALELFPRYLLQILRLQATSRIGLLPSIRRTRPLYRCLLVKNSV